VCSFEKKEKEQQPSFSFLAPCFPCWLLVFGCWRSLVYNHVQINGKDRRVTMSEISSDSDSGEPTKYGDHAYWDDRYGSWAPEPYDWLFEWKDVKPVFEEVLKVAGFLEPDQIKILVVGCGNAPLSVEMYDDGYTNQILTDTSQVVIEQMSHWHRKRKGMIFQIGDATDMSEFEDASFDVVIDKSLYDTIVCEDDGRRMVLSMFDECYRVLRPKGLLFDLSLHIHYDIMGVLYLGCYEWSVFHARLNNPSYEPEKENSERHTLAVAQKDAIPDDDDCIESESDSFLKIVLDSHDSRSVRQKRTEDSALLAEHLKRQLRNLKLAFALGAISEEQRSDLKISLIKHQDHHDIAKRLFKMVTYSGKATPQQWIEVVSEQNAETHPSDLSDTDDQTETEDEADVDAI
jgi:SAM-dependent methyltransferase